MKHLALCALFLIFAPSLRASEKKEPLKTINVKKDLSTLIEFNEAPKGFVLGNRKAFFIERLDKRLVVNLIDDAPQSSNLFVLFKGEKMAFLYLIANEGLEHVDFLKIDFPEIQKTKSKKIVKKKRKKKFPWGRISVVDLGSYFSRKKDYLQVRLKITNGFKKSITPALGYAAIKSGNKFITPDKVKSERRSISSGSSTVVTLTFQRPDLPGNKKSFQVSIPIKETKTHISTSIFPKGGVR